jgi:hypothetical protein
MNATVNIAAIDCILKAKIDTATYSKSGIK